MTSHPGVTGGAGPPDGTAHSTPLRRAEVDGDPLVQFVRWFDDATAVVRLPEAAALATVGADGRPSVRMVLLKGWDERGFVFHTHYDSRKARDLTAHPCGALLVYWDALGRQVRVEGDVVRTSGAESDRYFETRPRGGQIGAHASHQSRPIAGREELDRRVAELTARYDGVAVPRPECWGGFRLHPETYEFWQNREDRLHDRFRYSRDAQGWRIERLQP